MPSPSGSTSESIGRTDLYYGVFVWHTGADGSPHLARRRSSPPTIPCPTTGRALRIATIDAEATAICPSCSARRRGGFVSFVGDLRMAYACPECRCLIWVAGV